MFEFNIQLNRSVLSLELARAKALLNQKKPNIEAATKILQSLIKRGGAQWPVYHLAGVAALMMANYEKAADYLKKAINSGSNESETYHSYSLAQYHLGRLNVALDYANKAIEIKKDFFEAWLHLGSIYRDTAKLEDALRCYQKANQLDPKSAGVAFRIAAIYADQGDMQKALELFDITLKIDAEYEEARVRKGIILQQLRRFEEAEECFNYLRSERKDHLGATVGLAELHKAKGEYDKVLELYEQVIEDYPHLTGLLVNYALCLQELGQFDKSEQNYLKALKDNPSIFESFSSYLMALHYNPNRTREEIYKEHLKWDGIFAYKTDQVRPIPKNIDLNKKLKIGFISSGFRRHPVGWMIIKALENLSKDDFSIHCYNTNNIVDNNTIRIRNTCDVWKSVVGYSDEVTAQIIREDEIDILVELSGHSEDNRLRMVTLNPAPIVVKWVGGLFNTTGLSAIDYLLTDWNETPLGEEEFYTEKLVRMPDDYICYLKPDYTPDVNELPALENGYITFGCFNNPAKINDVLLKHWAELMHKVPNSKLFFKSKQYGAPVFTNRILDLMEDWGITNDRILFEKEAPHNEFLEAYNKVDIALDPWPYSGGLSTIEALIMGVPVISNPGPTFAGRHAATHLINIGMAEWVTENWATYKETIVSLTQNLNALANIRANLRSKVENSSIYDGERFAAHVSKALRLMWEQRVEGYKAGLKEDEWQNHIVVEPMLDSEIIRKENVVSTQIKANEIPIENFTDIELLTEDDVTLSVPDDIKVLTTYALKERKRWIDPELEMILKILKKGNKVIDVGAGFGTHAIPIAKQIGSTGIVFAFEPSKKTSVHLRKSKFLNEVDHIQILEMAISDEEGTSTFGGGIVPELEKLGNGSVQVKISTIDNQWKYFGKPIIDLLKIDVNGDEFLVLNGAKRLLIEQSPTVVIANNHDSVAIKKIRNLLAELGYQLFEYLPGIKVLNEYAEEDNPFQLNLFALKIDKINTFFTNGWIYDANTKIVEPNLGVWMPYIFNMPWTKALSGDWSAQRRTNENDKYLRALDYICEAEIKLQGAKSNRSSFISDVTNLLLSAANVLIERYNEDQNNVAISFTLARIFNLLGKRLLAVSILKEIMESLMMSKNNPKIDIPFLLPLKEQDSQPVQTDINTWLKVKAVESWLLLKDVSTYFSSEQDKKLFQNLNGNPEVIEIIQHISEHLLSKEQNHISKHQASFKKPKFIHIAFNHVYAKCLSDLLEYTNQNSDQEHWLYVDVHNAIDGYTADIEANTYSNWFNCQKQLSIVIERCLAEEVEAVFFHGLFFPWQKEIIDSIASQKHIGWIIWGGDLYNPIKKGQLLTEIVAKIDSIHTIVNGDIKVFEDTYGKRMQYKFGYTYPNLYGSISDISKVEKKPQIIVGNSGDESNNHIQILGDLARKSDIKEYELLIPVSYNFNTDYEKRLNTAIRTFGLDKNTKLLKEFIAPSEYFKLISNSVMLVTAHHRQQAVGNILTSIYCGNSTFLRKEIKIKGVRQSNPTWEFLESNGLKARSYQSFQEANSISELVIMKTEEVTSAQKIILEKFGLGIRAEELMNSCKDIISVNAKKKEAETVDII